MEINEINSLTTFYHRQLAAVDFKFKRYLHSKINWDTRLIAIKGARGVGKTTMVLQHIKETYSNPDDAFYVSLDHFWFQNHTLQDLVEYLYSRGICHLYLDEVHKYKGWATLLKNFYDAYPDLKIVYTGSSMLEIDNSKTDLARRQTVYTLHGMSFREYLEYEGVAKFDPQTLDILLSGHTALESEICSRVRILKYFAKYLEEGYYPFYKEAGKDYPIRLHAVSSLVIESDFPAVQDVTYATVEKTKKLLMVIAENLPLQLNVNQLSQALASTRDSCIRMLYALDRASLLNLLTVELKSYKRLTCPEKIYLNNTNLMYALADKVNVGTLRETFFMNQLSAALSVQAHKKGDFLVDGKYVFEVGGPDKGFSQIAGVDNSWLAIDDIEYGTGNRIPLWLFGFLY